MTDLTVSDPVAEEWRSVATAEGYEVSNLGRVRSIDRVKRFSQIGRGGYEVTRNMKVKGCLLRPSPKPNGYLVVHLSGKREYVHRLVLFAFVGPQPDWMECLHGDENNKANNKLSNLRWGTRSQNVRESMARGERRHNAKLKDKDIPVIRAQLAYRSCAQIGADFGVSKAAIRFIREGRSWNHIV